MQHGFTKGRPCQTDSISFLEKVTKNIAREVFPERGGSIHVFVWGPGGTLHTILLTCISGRYLPAGWDAERSAGRLGKRIWEAWLLSLMGMLARDAAESSTLERRVPSKGQRWHRTCAYRVVQSRFSLQGKLTAKAMQFRQRFPRKAVGQKADCISGWALDILEGGAQHSGLSDT